MVISQPDSGWLLISGYRNSKSFSQFLERILQSFSNGSHCTVANCTSIDP
ncbi:hypothetical protein Hanom_Chr02g00107131 [Helianthus anomalus]